MKQKLNSFIEIIVIYLHQISLILKYWKCYIICKHKQTEEPKQFFYEFFKNSDSYKKEVYNGTNTYDTLNLIMFLPKLRKYIEKPYFFFQRFPSQNLNYYLYGESSDKFFRQVTPLKITYIKPYIYYEGITFQNILFSSFMIYNVCFHNCSFYNCDFENINFMPQRHTDKILYTQGFSNCKFYNTNFKECNLNSTFFSMGELQGVEFIKCKFSNSLFQRISFKNVWLQDQTVISNTLILSPSKFFDIKIRGVSSNIKVDSRCIISKFLYNDFINFTDVKKYQDYNSFIKKEALSEVSDTYNLFDQIRNQNFIRKSRDTDKQMYYQSQKANTRSLSFPKNIPGYLSEFSFGYGEKPFRSFFSILLVIIVFSILYMFSGFTYDSITINYSISGMNLSMQLFENYLKSLFFSFFTMITVGQGTSCPTGSISHIFMSIELFLGAIYMTLFTSSLFRKYTK